MQRSLFLPLAALALTLAAALNACSDHPLPVALAVPATPSAVVFMNQGCALPFTPIGMAVGTAEDRNGDGIVCQMETTPPGAVEKQFAIIDNSIPPATVGGCPRNFVSRQYMWDSTNPDPADRNNDGFLCTFTTSSGAIVTVDNNVKP